MRFNTHEISLVIEYLPTFALKNHRNVGKYTIHGASGYHIQYWLVVLTILNNMKVNGKEYPIYYGK